jgi:hypothetical protein
MLSSPQEAHARSLQSVASRTSRYNAHVITRGIREFLERDWRAARDSKDTYWADRIARLGPAEGLRIADELRRQAILQDPERPRPSARRLDLLSHVRVAELLRRARPTRRS